MNHRSVTTYYIHSTLENLRDSDLFADYPEVRPLELVGLPEKRVEGLPHPLEVGRQRRHREGRHPHQPRLGVLQSFIQSDYGTVTLFWMKIQFFPDIMTET